MKLSQLQLRRSRFTDVTIREAPDGSMDGEVVYSHEIEPEYNKESPLLWRISFSLEINSSSRKPFAYEGKVAAVGYFEVHPDCPESKRASLVCVNGASLLYGAIREMIISLTSRFEPGELILPTADFREIKITGGGPEESETEQVSKTPAKKAGKRARDGR